MRTPRRSTRRPPEGTRLLRLAWEDEDGVPHWTCGTCIDVSEQGLSLLTGEGAPCGATPEITLDRLPLVGRARVCHCTQKYGGRFIIGLEFTDLHLAGDSKEIHALVAGYLGKKRVAASRHLQP